MKPPLLIGQRPDFILSHNMIGEIIHKSCMIGGLPDGLGKQPPTSDWWSH